MQYCRDVFAVEENMVGDDNIKGFRESIGQGAEVGSFKPNRYLLCGRSFFGFCQFAGADVRTGDVVSKGRKADGLRADAAGAVQYFGGRIKACIPEQFVQQDGLLSGGSMPVQKQLIIALCQLIQLRNAYNGDWVPDWRKGFYTGHRVSVIGIRGVCGVPGKINIDNTYSAETPFFLHFKDDKKAVEFLRNFRPLIEKLKPLYGIKEGGEE